jgi:hypothetical protein
MTSHAPRPDPRTRDAILSALRARVAGYLPEWKATAGDAGDGLLALLANLRGILAQGLDRAPARAKLAYLETLGHSLMPGRPARVPLVFTLLDSAPQDVVLPARSQVGAKLPPPPASLEPERDAAPDRDAPRYFTTRTVSLTRGKLAALYSSDPRVDGYADHTTSATQGFVTFERIGAMPHMLYLGHDEFYRLAGAAEINLSFDMAGEYADRRMALDWEYLSKDGWLALEVHEDTTARLTRDGRITLRKKCGPDGKRDTVMGRESYWIRARVGADAPSARVVSLPADGSIVLNRAGALLAGDRVSLDGEQWVEVTWSSHRVVRLQQSPAGLREDVWLRVEQSRPPLSSDNDLVFGALPEVDVIRTQVGFTKDGLKPEAAYCDSATVDTENVFFPFGLQPAKFTTFHVASAETFQRRGAHVEIDVKLKAAGVAGASGVTLAYEYYNGENWTVLSPTLPVQFTDDTEAFTMSGRLSFICPLDWAECEVNGVKSYWLRIRIDSGGYGEPMQIAIDTSVTPPVVNAKASTLSPPAIMTLRLSYTYFTPSQWLDHCVAYNGFVYRDHSEDVKWTRRPFTPFLSNEEREPALHLGFDRKLPSGLIGIYVDVAEDGEGEPPISPFVWEYRTSEGWSELTVADETSGLRRSGMIQFVGVPDIEAIDGYGGALYRIRARLKPDARLQPAPVRGVWLNAVWGHQGESVLREIIGRSEGTPDQAMRVPERRLPVLGGELVEVREWVGQGAGWQRVVEGIPEADLRIERDAITGDPRAVWVRWHAREHLYAARADERAYALERTRGLLLFGGEGYGRIPRAGAQVAMSFVTAADETGNVPAHTITELRTGIAHVQAVDNPVVAMGGASAETEAAVIARASRALRHRARALSRRDYEGLAFEASPEVQRARCLDVTGGEGQVQRGWVTLVVVPRGAQRLPQPSAELRRRVREFLASRAPAALANRVRVIGPRYVEFGVIAQVVVSDAEQAALIEARLRARFDAWLHPTRGGSGGEGWPFGARVYLSDIAALVEASAGIDVATRVALRVDGACVSDVHALACDVLVAAGVHEIKVELAKEARRAAA